MPNQASPAEFSEYSFQKRFMATHYSYKDSQEITTSPLTEAFCLGYLTNPLTAGLVYYLFGTNARNNPMTGSIYAWPWQTDPISPIQPNIFQTYARKVSFRCTQDCYVRLVSLNPEYLRLAIKQGYGIPITQVTQSIIEPEHMVLASTATVKNELTLYPTYGIAAIFRAPPAGLAGTLYITAEGNVEGSE